MKNQKFIPIHSIPSQRHRVYFCLLSIYVSLPTLAVRNLAPINLSMFTSLLHALYVTNLLATLTVFSVPDPLALIMQVMPSGPVLVESSAEAAAHTKRKENELCYFFKSCLCF